MDALTIEVIQFLESNIGYLQGGFLAILLLFIRSYIQERGKLKALKTENRKLIDETEKIKIHYSKELEELKKEHQLDISRRKYQYESKKEQYLKFFQLLDQFTRENNVKIQENLLPILDEFNRNFLAAASQNNKKKETNATTIMSKKIQKLMFDANQDLIRIKQETNTIRLIASEAILEKLDMLDLAYNKLMDESSIMMNNLHRWMATNNQKQMKEDQIKIEIAGKVVSNIRDEIIKLMRTELNEL